MELNDQKYSKICWYWDEDFGDPAPTLPSASFYYSSARSTEGGCKREGGHHKMTLKCLSSQQKAKLELWKLLSELLKKSHTPVWKVSNANHWTQKEVQQPTESHNAIYSHQPFIPQPSDHHGQGTQGWWPGFGSQLLEIGVNLATDRVKTVGVWHFFCRCV